jgi:hypothetical protein
LNIFFAFFVEVDLMSSSEAYSDESFRASSLISDYYLISSWIFGTFRNDEKTNSFLTESLDFSADLAPYERS